MKTADRGTAQRHRQPGSVVPNGDKLGRLLRSTVPHVKRINGEHAVVVNNDGRLSVRDELAHVRQ
jgi:hypothetical protein